MKIDENSACDSFLCMYIAYVKQCKFVLRKIKVMDGCTIQDYACKRGLKTDPEQEFTK